MEHPQGEREGRKTHQTEEQTKQHLPKGAGEEEGEGSASQKEGRKQHHTKEGWDSSTTQKEREGRMQHHLKKEEEGPPHVFAPFSFWLVFLTPLLLGAGVVFPPSPPCGCGAVSSPFFFGEGKGTTIGN